LLGDVPNKVSRSGVNPEPTVKVRMGEDVWSLL